MDKEKQKKEKPSKAKLNGMWNYFLSLENDISNTSRYIEPIGQENAYSFEFAKILVLGCTELESVFKALCFEINDSEPGDIGKYKSTILTKYPKIVEAEVKVPRLDKTLKPFAGWDVGPLAWWDSYQLVKHSRGEHFGQASYINAVTALAALYAAIFYLAATAQIEFENTKSNYFDSDYEDCYLLSGPQKRLPDFEKNT